MTPLRAARATFAIAVTTVIAFIAALLAGPPHLFLQAGFIPARVFAPLPFPAVPVALTPLTATLLHGGWMHLGFNLLLLVACGREVERVLGIRGFIVLYVLGAYGAALGQTVPDPMSTTAMVGASGAISAIVAAYAMIFGRDQTRAIGPLSSRTVRALWLAAAWCAIQWLVGIATGTPQLMVATAAHVGGFLTGLLAVTPLLLWRYRTA